MSTTRSVSRSQKGSTPAGGGAGSRVPRRKRDERKLSSSDRAVSVQVSIASLSSADAEPGAQAAVIASLQNALESKPAQTASEISGAAGVPVIAGLCQSDDPELRWRSIALLAALPSSVVPADTRRQLQKELPAAVEVISIPPDSHVDEEQLMAISLACSFLATMATADLDQPAQLLAAVRPLCALLRAKDAQKAAVTALTRIVQQGGREFQVRLRDDGCVSGVALAFVSSAAAPDATPVAAGCAEVLATCCALDHRSRSITNDVLIASLLASALRIPDVGAGADGIALARSSCRALASLVAGNERAARLALGTSSPMSTAARLLSLLRVPDLAPEAAKLAVAFSRHHCWIAPLASAGAGPALAEVAAAAKQHSADAATALSRVLAHSPAAGIAVLQVPDLVESLVAISLDSAAQAELRVAIVNSMARLIEACASGPQTMAELGFAGLLASLVEEPVMCEAALGALRALATSDRETARKISTGESSAGLLPKVMELAAIGNLDALLIILACSIESGSGARWAIPALLQALRTARASSPCKFPRASEAARTSLLCLSILAKAPELAVPLCEAGAPEQARAAAELWPDVGTINARLFDRLCEHDLSARFFLRHRIGPESKLTDGFYVIPEVGARFRSLEEIRAEKVHPRSPTAVVWSPKADKKLADLLAKAAAIPPTDTTQRILDVRKIVLDQMGGELGIGSSCSQAEAAVVKARLLANVFPISEPDHGCIVLRAVLFKGLADSLGIPCTLEASCCSCWNVVSPAGSPPVLVDLTGMLNSPLIPPGSPAAASYQVGKW